MLDPNHPISKLAREDGRYCVDAYTFVFDALNHAHTIIQQEVGDEAVATEEADSEAAEIDQLLLSEEIEIADTDVDEEIECLRKIASEEQGEAEETERHVTGQELCGAIRSLAVDQYGYMAKCGVFSLIPSRTLRRVKNDFQRTLKISKTWIMRHVGKQMWIVRHVEMKN